MFDEPSVDQPELASGEDLLLALRGIGAVMFLTTDRLIVSRDGGDRRPRSGTQSFALDEISHIRVEPGEQPSGRIAVWIGAREGVSMFFDSRSRDRANGMIATARPLMARRRREQERRGRRTAD